MTAAMFGSAGGAGGVLGPALVGLPALEALETGGDYALGAGVLELGFDVPARDLALPPPRPPPIRAYRLTHSDAQAWASEGGTAKQSVLHRFAPLVRYTVFARFHGRAGRRRGFVPLPREAACRVPVLCMRRAREGGTAAGAESDDDDGAIDDDAIDGDEAVDDDEAATAMGSDGGDDASDDASDDDAGAGRDAGAGGRG